MALANETATLAEVAAALGRRESWLRRNWVKLADEQGFPRKLPCGPVWPRHQVELWCRTGGAVPAAPTANDNSPSLPPDYVAAIHQHYGIEL